MKNHLGYSVCLGCFHKIPLTAYTGDDERNRILKIIESKRRRDRTGDMSVPDFYDYQKEKFGQIDLDATHNEALDDLINEINKP